LKHDADVAIFTLPHDFMAFARLPCLRCSLNLPLCVHLKVHIAHRGLLVRLPC
jgi:hypothetical protein